MKQIFVLLLLAIFAFVPQVNAQSLPSLPTVYENQYEIFMDIDGYTFAIVSYNSGVDYPYTIGYNESMKRNEIKLKNTTGSTVSCYIYQLTDNNTWLALTSKLADSNSHIYVMSGQNIEFKSSDLNIYDEYTNNLVFPLPEEIPLHLLPEKMMAENKAEMMEKILKAMKIILLCGVGCLALLISSPILLKILRKFLAK